VANRHVAVVTSPKMGPGITVNEKETWSKNCEVGKPGVGGGAGNSFRLGSVS
jgi:hypothetical protein